MRPKAIRTFEILYFGEIELVLANAVRAWFASATVPLEENP